MTITVALALGLAAGLHGALYGAYKDSPHESFLLRRFIREIVIASAVALALYGWHLADGETPFIVYVSIFALARIATEFWKLFVRVEPQEDFRIPTQIHCVNGVIHNPAARLLLGLGFLASIYGCYCLSTLIPHSLPRPAVGLLVGLCIGCAEAVAGAYKDGTIEGFYWSKFAKSPSFGALGGIIAAAHTDSLPFLLLASIGTMRMLLELVFKIVRPGYAPGKFRSMTGAFPTWLARRSMFLRPYAATWALYLVLCSRPW